MGSDSGGALCRDVLIREGVTPILQTVPEANTAYACILTDRRGENQVTVYRGAADLLSADFLRAQEAVLARCTHLLLGLECPLDATKAALAIAKKHGIFTILNPAPAIPLELDFLRSFDLITPNQQEAAVLLGLNYTPEPSELADRLRAARLTNAVVTLGRLLFPALPAAAMDTTGAGDTFNAALAVALSRGKSIPEALEFATNASAWSVARRHVLDALPTADQLTAAYRTVSPIPLR